MYIVILEGVDCSMRKDILDREDEIRKWVKEGRSKSFICDQLKCKYDTLNTYLEKLDIVYAGNQGHNYTKGLNNNTYIPLEEYLRRESPRIQLIKDKLFIEGYKEYRCEICGVSHWQGKILPLELHHRDGNNFNNTLENFQILCPNCHSIQEGNSGSNVGTYSSTNLIDIRDRRLKQAQQKSAIRMYQSELALKKSLLKIEKANKHDEEVQRIKDIILHTSAVDFSKFGWVTKLSEVPGINIPRHKITNWMKKYMPDFLETCYVYKRDRPHIYDKD